MSLPRFAYLSPATLDEALSLASGGSVFVAGGTDLFVRMKDRICTPTRVIDLKNIAELHGVAPLTNGGVSIGAATTLSYLAETASTIPALRGLRDAIHLTSSPLLRNSGTLGGNLCQEARCSCYNQSPIFRKRWQPCLKLGGNKCHVVKGSEVCHAVYSGDLAGPLMAMKAAVTIVSRRGLREVKIADLFTGLGLRPTVLDFDEILTKVRIPSFPPSCGFSYQKLRLRDTIDFPILGISLFLEFDPSEYERRIQNARLVLSATGPTPLMVPEAEPLLRGQVVNETQAEKLALLTKKMALPVANTAASPGYRREMIPVLIRHALRSISKGVMNVL